MLPGCAVWAVIYAVGGLAAFEAGVVLAARSPLALAAFVLVVALLVAAVVLGLRRRRNALDAIDALADRAAHQPGDEQG